MKNWAGLAREMIKLEGQVILATLGPSKGSTPRGSGTKMLIGRKDVQGTIGGGNLEYMVIEQARRMMADRDVHLLYQHYALGPLLSQCCGGATNILLEKLTAEQIPLLDQVRTAIEDKIPYGLISGVAGCEISKKFVTIKPEEEDNSKIYEWNQGDALPLYMFGAGHVGKAMAVSLGRLNFEVTWIDDRADMFPELIADNVEKIVTDHPADFVAKAPADSIFLIFTYSHQLDYQISRAILERGDARFCGMIGSQTKRARFENFFLKDGGCEAELANFTCPIGLDGIKGKEPDVIALSVAAQLLKLFTA